MSHLRSGQNLSQQKVAAALTTYTIDAFVEA